MKKINHPDMVKQLAKSGEDIIKDMTPGAMHLLHMAVGISGESGELLEAILDVESFQHVDEENVKEELGDMEFYLEGYRQEIQVLREDTITYQDEDFSHHGISFLGATLDFARLSAASGKLLDDTKKMAIYAKSLDIDLAIKHLKEVELYLESIRQHFGILYEETIDHNIDKLGIRYKGHNYSNEQAQNRADKLSDSV
jgi:NTP pyrophosphatase (non-canonical NTP hydrolase)